MTNDEERRKLRARSTELRARYTACLRRWRWNDGSLAWRADPPAALPDDAQVIAARLRELASALGEDPGELERFFEFEQLKLEYFTHAVNLGFEVADEAKAGDLQQSYGQKLREFCLATGRDLADLNRVYHEVEEDVIGLLAK